MTESESNERYIRMHERIDDLERVIAGLVADLNALHITIQDFEYTVDDVARDVRWIEDQIADVEDEVRNHDHG